VLGTELAGALSRARIYEGAAEGSEDILAELNFNGGSVAGQGFGAFNAWGLVVRVEGGAQDGVGKTMLGGTVSIMKGRNAAGERVNGSVGKSFAYGAQRGRLFVQGSADSRFCIRLSGADVVLAGEPAQPLDDSKGCLVDRANAKGFAFEYMTSGRAVVLGDIGPWACAGMTGGRVYARVNPEWNLDREAIERRLGEGAKVHLSDLDPGGVLDIEDLLGHYAEELRATDQDSEAERILELAASSQENFLMIVPERVQADPNISTE
jgi:glutamate synthase (NADPH) large chain